MDLSDAASLAAAEPWPPWALRTIAVLTVLVAILSKYTARRASNSSSSGSKSSTSSEERKASRSSRGRDITKDDDNTKTGFFPDHEKNNKVSDSPSKTTSSEQSCDSDHGNKAVRTADREEQIHFMQTQKQLRREKNKASFRTFQLKYLSVYLTIMLADWLQGTNMYTLYEDEYGVDTGTLFLTGFLSSAVLGTYLGLYVDLYGRKKACLFFCWIEIVINLIEHVNNFPLLLFGRVLSGISSSLLFSAFEAWMVSEHRRRKFPEKSLNATFAIASAGNGIVAIIGGLLAQIAADKRGDLGPFQLAIALTVVCLLLILFLWEEDKESSVGGGGAATVSSFTTSGVPAAVESANKQGNESALQVEQREGTQVVDSTAAIASASVLQGQHNPDLENEESGAPIPVAPKMSLPLPEGERNYEETMPLLGGVVSSADEELHARTAERTSKSVSLPTTATGHHLTGATLPNPPSATKKPNEIDEDERSTTDTSDEEPNSNSRTLPLSVTWGCPSPKQNPFLSAHHKRHLTRRRSTSLTPSFQHPGGSSSRHRNTQVVSGATRRRTSTQSEANAGQVNQGNHAPAEQRPRTNLRAAPAAVAAPPARPPIGARPEDPAAGNFEGVVQNNFQPAGGPRRETNNPHAVAAANNPARTATAAHRSSAARGGTNSLYNTSASRRECHFSGQGGGRGGSKNSVTSYHSVLSGGSGAASPPNNNNGMLNHANSPLGSNANTPRGLAGGPGTTMAVQGGGPQPPQGTNLNFLQGTNTTTRAAAQLHHAAVAAAQGVLPYGINQGSSSFPANVSNDLQSVSYLSTATETVSGGHDGTRAPNIPSPASVYKSTTTGGSSSFIDELHGTTAGPNIRRRGRPNGTPEGEAAINILTRTSSARSSQNAALEVQQGDGEEEWVYKPRPRSQGTPGGEVYELEEFSTTSADTKKPKSCSRTSDASKPEDKPLLQHLKDTCELIAQTPTILCLGLSQAFYEGGVFTFVFMWVPNMQMVLNSQKIPTGLIFACFMLAMTLGGILYTAIGTNVDNAAAKRKSRGANASAAASSSTIFLFSLLNSSGKISLLVYAIAALSMCVPLISYEFWPVFISFLVLEVSLGMYNACGAAIRAELYPDEHQSRLVNVFRVPLNLLVVVGTKLTSHAGSDFSHCFYAVVLMFSTAVVFQVLLMVCEKRGEQTKTGAGVVLNTGADEEEESSVSGSAGFEEKKTR
ncbi:unnamed protein product [Amoebophrya sp. A120]|nr:unnamed protein product [Amoebophrya sp. A120]|eukprot:GSA120T00009086001.1